MHYKLLYAAINKTYSYNNSSCFSITSDRLLTDPKTFLS